MLIKLCPEGTVVFIINGFYTVRLHELKRKKILIRPNEPKRVFGFDKYVKKEGCRDFVP